MMRSSNLSQQQPPTPTTLTTSAAVKLIVNFDGDKYVVVVLSSTPFNALLEKVTKKVRVCSDKPIDHTLRMRYIDEDGDNVLINDDEDVQMAFEIARNNPNGQVELVVN